MRKLFKMLLATIMVAFFMQENIYASTFNGIDVSNNDEYINWDLVKGYTNTVIIKATEGIDYVDPALERNYQGALNRGMNIGLYHFFSERTSPSQQAVDFYKAIKNKRYNIIPVLDIETNTWGRSPHELTDRALEFLNKFKELSGIDCMIYSGAYFSRDELDFRIKKYKLWEAHYNGCADMTCMQTGYAELVGHQYSETGIVPGIDTYCDLNVFNDGIFLSNASNNIENCIPYVNVNCIGKVAQLQQILNNLGYSLYIDNIYGPKTDNALRDSGLLAGLPYKTPELTTWVQLRLGVNADGIFGTGTEQAVKNWQSEHGLTIDGIAGYNTIKSLALA